MGLSWKRGPQQRRSSAELVFPVGRAEAKYRSEPDIDLGHMIVPLD